jgi:predicted ATPase
MKAYVVRKSVVARSLARLREQRTHTLFTGYLHLYQRAAQLGRLDDLQPEFLPYFKRFFLVGNHPLGTPYIKPFTEQKASTKNLWLNENVAGSYAPSSLRPGQPFRRVVKIEGRTYSLFPDHARRAFEHLLYSIPVQAADLAVVLYRDFGLLGDSPTIENLVGIFAYEFGYASEPGAPLNDNFATLYSMESAENWNDDWLETGEFARNSVNELTWRRDSVSSNRTRSKIRSLTAEDLLSLRETKEDNKLALQEILIEGLLSFGEKTNFKFGRLNILVGPNGSGKSNLIDCLRVLRYAPLDIEEAFRKGGFEEWLYNGIDKHSGTAFLQVIAKVAKVPEAIRHQLRIGPSLKGRAPLEEVLSSTGSEREGLDQYFVGSHRSGATLSVAGAGKRRRQRQLDAREYDPFRSILSQVRDIGQYPEIAHLASLYASFRIYSEWSFGRNSNLREATPAGRSETRLSESMEDLPLALNGLEQTAAHEKIRVLLRELKETYRDYVTRILFGRVGLELVEAPFEQLPLPANRLSDGTLRFLALAAILLPSDLPSLICIEEPELGMHPDMIRIVAEMIIEASAKTQLIVTTHSEHLLSALQDDFDELFAFDSGSTGSVVKRFSREEFNDWRQEHTLGDLWTSGELGGNRW